MFGNRITPQLILQIWFKSYVKKGYSILDEFLKEIMIDEHFPIHNFYFDKHDEVYEVNY